MPKTPQNHLANELEKATNNCAALLLCGNYLKKKNMDFFLCHIPCSENQTLRKLKLQNSIECGLYVTEVWSNEILSCF